MGSNHRGTVEGEDSFRGRLIEGRSSSYSFNQTNFPTLPSANHFGGSPSSQHNAARQAAHSLQDIGQNQSADPTETLTYPPSQVPVSCENNFPYAVPMVMMVNQEAVNVPPKPQQVYPDVYHTAASVQNVSLQTPENVIVQPRGSRYLVHPQQPAFFPQQVYHHHPIIYDNLKSTPQYVQMVDSADYTGLMAPPLPMWINPPVQSTRCSNMIKKVDRGSDAIILTTYMDKATQICPEDLQTKVITQMETDAKVDESWVVPNLQPGEKLHGWEDSQSCSENKISRSREKIQSPKIDTLMLENCALGNKDYSVSSRKKSPSPSKKRKSKSPAKKQPMSLEKIDPVETAKDVGADDGANGSTEIDFKRINEEAEEYRRAQLASMIPIIKNVYQEDPGVSSLSYSDVETIRDSFNIKVHFPKPEELSPVFNVETKDLSEEYSAKNIPNPVTTFAEAYKDYPEILEEVAKQGFANPTPIQCQLWPCIMKGHDVVGIAQTGSGKTLGFLLPAFVHIEKQMKPRAERNGPTVLVLAPTRELAQQIHSEVLKYNYKGISSVCIYGGNSRSEQIDNLRRKPEIVIATAGRLIDLINADALNLKEVSFLILDEADEMLDQGFEPQINKALMRVRSDRQTILTSATWPESVRRMAKNYTKNPIMVVIGTVELKAVQSVKQNIVMLEENEKYDWLIEFLKTKMTKNEKLIVFVGRKAFADHLSSELSLMRLECACIHGGLPQSERDKAIQDMKSGDSRVLIASDVVARGIDIEMVTYIINYDVPRSSEMYIHRIGRTGRAGNTGESFTLVTYRDWNKAQDLINILQGVGQEVPQELVNMAERFKKRRVSDQSGEYRRGGGGGRGYRQDGDNGRQGYSNSYGNRGSDSHGSNRDSGSYGSTRGHGHRPRGYGDYQGSGHSDGTWSRGQEGYQGRGRGRSYDN